jgi:hypothetical protein
MVVPTVDILRVNGSVTWRERIRLSDYNPKKHTLAPEADQERPEHQPAIEAVTKKASKPKKRAAPKPKDDLEEDILADIDLGEIDETVIDDHYLIDPEFDQ